MTLTPKSSRSYHQLAIIAIYTKRRLDACYYYFRCLEVSTPLSSVKQSLNQIFEESRMKSDSIVKMISNAMLIKREKETNANKSKLSKQMNNKHRVEVWHRASAFQQSNVNKQNASTYGGSESSTSSEDDQDEEEDEFYSTDDEEKDENSAGKFRLDFNCLKEKKLSVNELNKRFMLNYLNTVGKLFTKVGMESYQEVSELMLQEFGELLKREPCPLGKMR
jgi:protein SMG6